MTFRCKKNWTIIAIVSALLIMAWVIPVSAAMTFGSIAPTSGPTTGGTPVTITGIDFVDGALFDVTIGGANANGVYVNPTTITATTPAHAAGAVNVVITNGDGQTDTGTNAFTYIAPAPTFGSIAPTSGPTTGGTPVTITGTHFVSGGSFGVTIGGSNANGVYVNPTTITATTPAHAAGAVNVVITNGDGQTVTGMGAFTYEAAPVAPIAAFTNATPRSGPAPLTVSFTDQSTGSITLRSWNFGDGGTSTIPSPSHQYTAVGTYYVNLTVTGPGGSDFENKSNYIEVGEPAPVAGFSATPISGPKPLNVQFSDESIGVITTYTWDFGDGHASNARNPSHQYTAVGSYSVTLTVTGPGGSDFEIKTNYITVGDSPPVAGFYGTPTSGPKPLNVQFTDASMGNITTFAWNFGDGGTSTARNPSHLYTEVGNYTVILTVTGPGGASTKTEPDYIRIASSATRIGIYKDGVWNLDSTGLEVSDASLSWGLPGDIQVIGDWNGDGKDDIGIFRPSSGIWSLDSNGDNTYNSGVKTPKIFRGEAGWTPLVGDWNGSGTTKIGVYKTGTVYLDYNGNGVWDSGSDKGYNFGLTSDFIPVVGDWNGDGKTKLGFYRWGYWSLDYYGVGTKSKFYTFPYADTYVYSPIVGDWNGDRITEIGAYTYTNGDWCLDYDGNGVWNSGLDRWYNLGGSGWMPVVGDWNGDGKAKIGVFNSNYGDWELDYIGNGSVIKNYHFGATGSQPVIGDWNGDGKAEIGVYNSNNGDWNLDYDGNGVWNATTDKVNNIGMGTPVVGKWS
jgi:PKD repeat protein